MNVNVYSIYDRKGKSYSPPFLANTDELAIRMVVGSISPTSNLALYPSDFQLYHLGSFSDVSGLFTSDVVRPLSLIRDLVPNKYRDCALDGSYSTGGVDCEKAKENPSA